VDLLQGRVANGWRFEVGSFVESGDQVAATLTISGPGMPDSVNVTKIFTFRRGANVVVQINDGVDVLALRAQAAAFDDAGEEG
jgi:hypothetical protein